jgi:hypothetical protein
MAAGLGFKTFTTGEVLTAADTNGYLMQGILVFASAAARDSAITSPQEGQFAYLKDTNVTTYYTGSAWANVDTTGMTNPMTTTGDIIYSSPGSTPVRLGIGTANQVLRVNSGATAPEWATPAGGGGKVLQVVSGTYATQTTIATTTFTDTGLTLSITPTLSSSKVLVIASQTFYAGRDSGQAGGNLRLVRGATTVYTAGGTGGNEAFYVGTSASNPRIAGLCAINYLDSPATTSSTTYKIQIRSYESTSNADVTCQAGTATSTITLLEIGV